MNSSPAQLDVQAVLSRLSRVRRSGGGWIACCPAHGDRSPSLSIRLLDGRLVLHCFAGCPSNAIWSAIGISRPAALGKPDELPAWSAARRAEEKRSRPDMAKLARQYERSVTSSEMRRFADSLFLPVGPLRFLRVGWAMTTWDAKEGCHVLKGTNTPCRGDGAWTFPMSDESGQIIGIRVRTTDGAKCAKFSIRGSDNGIFLPKGLEGGGQLLLPEGPTSLSAVMTLGFKGAGRTNNSAGIGILRHLVMRLRPTRVVVIGDNDERWNEKLGRWQWPGRDGALRTAWQLRDLCRDTRVLFPTQKEVKDTRDWLKAGATSGEIQDAIERTEELRNAG